MKLARLYVRTPAGRAAAFSTGTPLTAALRTLLVAVDGKTATNVLEMRLMALGSVAHLLVELESAGLIMVRPEPQKPAVNTQAHDAPIGGLIFQNNPVAAAHPNTSDDNARYRELMRSERVVQPPARSEKLAPHITDAMATFIQTHMPDMAHSVLTQLETLHTQAQLQDLLPSYEAMVKMVGSVGYQHWDEIQAMNTAGSTQNFH